MRYVRPDGLRLAATMSDTHEHARTHACMLRTRTHGQVNLEHPENVTALMYGAAGAHIPVVDFLLSKGARVNQQHAHGGSALMEACSSGNPQLVTLLLKHGADATIRDRDGVSTLMAAAAQGHAGVVDLLLKLRGAAVGEDDQ